MGRTIIQPIGPLYGEAVNGTVFGRPNGSVYVPPTNTITANLTQDYLKKVASGWILLCSSLGATVSGINISATAQDNLAYMRAELSDDSEFGNIIATNTYAAGNFNVASANVLFGSNEATIVNGTTYYYRVVLVSSSGVAVATSSTKELTGWASE